MSAHTPGPWDASHGWVQAAADKKPVASFNFYAASDANMLLIAAAPDLLEALSALVSRKFVYHGGFVVDCNITEEEVERARAAIAKATGG